MTNDNLPYDRQYSRVINSRLLVENFVPSGLTRSVSFMETMHEL